MGKGGGPEKHKLRFRYGPTTKQELRKEILYQWNPFYGKYYPRKLPPMHSVRRYLGFLYTKVVSDTMYKQYLDAKYGGFSSVEQLFGPGGLFAQDKQIDKMKKDVFHDNTS